jgi:hypothetical protein
MTSMTPIPIPQIHALSRPASFWPRAAAPEALSRSSSIHQPLRKIHPQLAQAASSSQTDASDAGASARKTDRPALSAAFKSP